MVIATSLVGILISARGVRKNLLISGMHDQKYEFYRYFNIFAVTGIFLGLRNSYYRLTGLVPNGLPRIEEDELVKYDYTTDFLRDTFWGLFVEPQKK